MSRSKSLTFAQEGDGDLKRLESLAMEGGVYAKE